MSKNRRRDVRVRVVCSAGAHTVATLEVVDDHYELHVTETVHTGVPSGRILARPPARSVRSTYVNEDCWSGSVTCQCGNSYPLSFTAAMVVLKSGGRTLTLDATLADWVDPQRVIRGPAQNPNDVIN
ncbi:hypothetical protein BKA23_2093 [Rudaeicoccus suwonensis]|uniref:Uncharacterized protein n=1 Tax=Rudaeicoccus suwonensis TaxID=657409 RepID=A0A561ECC5_9MICO|nr:hypothetical protein BKA23_2093 [Rudaeicoccus suwonensis]